MPTVIILAAGRGARFLAAGGTCHKLDASLAGHSVLHHVLAAAEASGLPWHLVRPAGGTAGMGASIAAGVNATLDADGWLILPGDLPLIRPLTLQRVASALASHCVVVPRFRQRAGHPVGFARNHLTALTALSADTGAASIVRAARVSGGVRDLALNDAGIIYDIDTPGDLVRARRIVRRRALRDHTP